MVFWLGFFGGEGGHPPAAAGAHSFHFPSCRWESLSFYNGDLVLALLPYFLAALKGAGRGLCWALGSGQGAASPGGWVEAAALAQKGNSCPQAFILSYIWCPSDAVIQWQQAHVRESEWGFSSNLVSWIGLVLQPDGLRAGWEDWLEERGMKEHASTSASLQHESIPEISFFNICLYLYCCSFRPVLDPAWNETLSLLVIAAFCPSRTWNTKAPINHGAKSIH